MRTGSTFLLVNQMPIAPMCLNFFGFARFQDIVAIECEVSLLVEFGPLVSLEQAGVT
jgi:hypothetical protein